MTEAAGFAWETASSSVGGSTEYSNLCLMHLLISLDITHNTNKASQYKPPPNGAKSNIIAKSLQKAKLWSTLLRDDGTEVDLSNPKEIIDYFEDNIDKFVMDTMDEENRRRFVNVRERHYQKQKHADEYELYLLKKFYQTFDKQYVTTCEIHTQKLKRQYKKKFSWDNVWNQIEKRYGLGRDNFCTCTDLYVQSMKDQREMEQMFNLLPTTSNRDDDSSSRNVENEINEHIRNLSMATQADKMTKLSKQQPIIKHGKTHAELVEHYTSYYHQWQRQSEAAKQSLKSISIPSLRDELERRDKWATYYAGNSAALAHYHLNLSKSSSNRRDNGGDRPDSPPRPPQMDMKNPIPRNDDHREEKEKRLSSEEEEYDEEEYREALDRNEKLQWKREYGTNNNIAPAKQPKRRDTVLREVYHFPSKSQENEQGFKPDGYMHGLPFKKEKISLQSCSSSNNYGRSSDNGSNIDSTLPLKDQLGYALSNLRLVGGKELDMGGECEEDEDGPERYMDQLLAVCDIRYKWGQYQLAGSNYFRCYYIAMNRYKESGSRDCLVFPVAHKLFQCWMRVDNQNLLSFARATAEIVVESRGCPKYIKRDLKELDKAWQSLRKYEQEKENRAPSQYGSYPNVKNR